MSQKTIHGSWCCARMASPKRLAATEDVSLALTAACLSVSAVYPQCVVCLEVLCQARVIKKSQGWS